MDRRRWGSWLVLCAGCGSVAEDQPRVASPVVAVEAVDERPTPSPEPEPAEDRYSGVYTATHEVTYVCESPDWCTGEVTDRLTLEAVEGGLAVEVELTQANYHVCNWRGRMIHRQKQGGWVFEEADCRLELTATDEELRLRSEGCRDYCGARASLHADFPRPPASE